MKSLVFHIFAACAAVATLACSELQAQEYHKGDTIEISKRAELRSGRKVVGYAQRGEQFEVEKVQNGWLLVERNGTRGYVYKTNVRLADALAVPMHGGRGVPFGPVEVFAPGGPGPHAIFEGPGPPPDWDRPFEGRAGGRAIVIMANEFFALQNCGRAGHGIVIAGGPHGPNGYPGSASCTVELPEGASSRIMVIGIDHGGSGEQGKGIHGRRGGTVTVYVNKVAVHTFRCLRQGMYNDFWPDPLPHLGHDLPAIDLESKGIKGPKLTITFRVSGGTCMDIRSINVSFREAAAGLGGLVVTPQQFTPKTGHSFSKDMSAMVLNGGPAGPNETPGAASCKVTLGKGVDRVTIFINHGSQYGQGIHSPVRGRTLNVSINDVQVCTFTCEHRCENLPDYYPEVEPLRTHQLSVDLRAKSIRGRELTIKFDAAARTCMDIQSVRIAPELGGAPDEFPMPRFPIHERVAPDDFPGLRPRDR